jgi:predicted RNase H-like HicB family nuclease
VEKTGKEAHMKWRVILERDPETGDWAVWCPELPGCTSAGETQEEALEKIREAIALYLEPSPVCLPEGALATEVTVG